MLRRTLALALSLALGAAAPVVLADEADPAGAEAAAPKAVEAQAPSKGFRSDCSGTRIRPAVGKPCPSTTTLTRSYTQQDLQRTGQAQVYDALRLLDPIFR